MSFFNQDLNQKFEDYYGSIYGARWPLLRESLLSPVKAVPFNRGLKKPYMMDRASIIAAESLRLPESGLVLDACAAPGGKSLVLVSRMKDSSTLVSNEFSAERRRRLSKVLDEHLAEDKRRQIKITGFNAARLGRKKSICYDAILLDVPCSSERHVITDKKALEQWTPARPRFLCARQWSLLSAAFLILKEGGSLVYSTCAISAAENDGVVSRLLKKYGSRVIMDEPDFSESGILIGEKTQYGRIMLPDQCGGSGPMYVARFGKSPS